MAEDFRDTFGLGTDNKSIGVQDLASVSLAAINALEERTAEVAALTRATAAFEQRLAALRRGNASVTFTVTAVATAPQNWSLYSIVNTCVPFGRAALLQTVVA